MRKLKFLTTSLVVLGSFALVGCGGGNNGDGTSNGGLSGEAINLTVWGPTEQYELLGNMANKFKAANPDKNYNIKINVVSEADAFSNLQTDVSAGADVFAFANDQLVNLYRIGALARISTAIETDIRNTNDAKSVEAGVFNGGLYAYPYAADNGYFMYYNKAVLGNNTDRLDDILTTVNAAGKKFAFDLDNSWYDAGFFFSTGCSYTVEYNDQGAETNIDCDFDSANGVIAGKAMINLAKSPAFRNGDDEIFKAGFKDGSIAAAVTGTWNADAIKEALGENYAACKLPKFTVDGTDYQMKSFSGYKLMGVNRQSKNLSEAHKLAQFLTSESMQTLRFQEKSVRPSNLNSYAAVETDVKANVALNALEEQNQYSEAQVSVPSNFWGTVDTFGQEVVNGTVTLENLQAKLTAVAMLIRTLGSAN